MLSPVATICSTSGGNSPVSFIVSAIFRPPATPLCTRSTASASASFPTSSRQDLSESRMSSPERYIVAKFWVNRVIESIRITGPKSGNFRDTRSTHSRTLAEVFKMNRTPKKITAAPSNVCHQ